MGLIKDMISIRDNFFNKPDFHYEDFDGRDFDVRKVERKEKDWSSWLFSFLPTYFKMNDTYKTEDDHGLLERYLGAIDPLILSEIIPSIENYMDNIDAQTSKPKFLTHISDVLGNPPDVFDNDNKYRNLLSYVVSIYKIKGTIESYKLFFDILGFNAEIEEIPPKKSVGQYDLGLIYDNEEEPSYYDTTGCQYCSYYDITLYYKDVTNYIVTQEIINNIREAIVFNEPINAKLRNLTIGIRIHDTLTISIQDKDITTTAEVYTKYDSGNDYDEGLIYENDI